MKKHISLLVALTVLVVVMLSVGTAFADYQMGNSNVYWTQKDGRLIIKGYGDMADGEQLQWKKTATNVEIQDGVTGIGENNFAGATKILKISIPKSVTKVADSAFASSCIKTISLPKVKTIGRSAFAYCESLESIDLGTELKLIDLSAFENCPSLTSVTIPATTTKIAIDAFYGCDSLNRVVIESKNCDVGNDAFANCPKLKAIVVPCNALDFYRQSDNWSQFAGLITTEHEWDTEYTIDQPATCTEPGSKSKHCKVCDEKTRVTAIAPTGHKKLKQLFKDSKGHWYYCGNGTCMTVLEYSSHISSGPATTKKAEVCKVCKYEINPKLVPAPVVSIAGLKTASKKVTVSLKSTASVVTYEVAYRLYGTNSWKTKKVNTPDKATTLTISKLKKDNTYEFRVRASYKNEKNKKVYTDWSSIKSIKVK